MKILLLVANCLFYYSILVLTGCNATARNSLGEREHSGIDNNGVIDNNDLNNLLVVITDAKRLLAEQKVTPFTAKKNAVTAVVTAKRKVKETKRAANVAAESAKIAVMELAFCRSNKNKRKKDTIVYSSNVAVADKSKMTRANETYSAFCDAVQDVASIKRKSDIFNVDSVYKKLKKLMPGIIPRTVNSGRESIIDNDGNESLLEAAQAVSNAIPIVATKRKRDDGKDSAIEIDNAPECSVNSAKKQRGDDEWTILQL